MLLNVEDFRRAARRKLPRFVFDYVDGGAEDEDCLRRNTSDLRRLHLIPSCLRDTSKIDTSIEVFGRRWSAPLAIAPIGFSGLVRPKGDELLARSAAEIGVPFTLSTASNERIESVRGAAPDGEQWMQLYVMSDRSIAEQIVKRARREGYRALVLTVDVPVSGYRERDIRNGFKLPFRPTLPVLVDLMSHPRWLLGVALHGMPRFVNLSEGEDSASSAQLQAALLARAMDRSLVWESLDWLRELWDGPLLIKGLLDTDDAREAIRRGIDGIIVSNHGGRQLDAAPSTISVLPEIVQAVNGKLPIFVDSGFRRGSDIAKALAIGAKAVLIGRPAIYGLACSGSAGVASVLKILTEELARSLTLLGVNSPAELNWGHLRHTALGEFRDPTTSDLMRFLSSSLETGEIYD